MSESLASASDVHMLHAEVLDMQSELSEFYHLQESACEVIQRQCRELVLLKREKDVQEERAQEFEARLKAEIGLGAAAVGMQQESASAMAGLLRDREKNHEQLLSARQVVEEQAQKIVALGFECENVQQHNDELEERLRVNAATLEAVADKCERTCDLEAVLSEEIEDLREITSQRDAELLASAISHESTACTLEALSAGRTQMLEELQRDSQEVTERLTFMEDRELALQCEVAERTAAERYLRLQLAESGPILSETRQWGRVEANALHVEAVAVAQFQDEASAAVSENNYLRGRLAARELQLERIQSLMETVRRGGGYSSCLHYDFGEALLGSPFTDRSNAHIPDTHYGMLSNSPAHYTS